MADGFVTVAKADDVPSGEARVVVVAGRRVALCNVDGTFHAVDDTCTHDNGPLGAGTLDGCAIKTGTQSAVRAATAKPSERAMSASPSMSATVWAISRSEISRT